MIFKRKPRLKFQHGQWHLTIPTAESWSWYVGAGDTVTEAWACMGTALRLAAMIRAVGS
jgi:hypothetical protein